MNIQHFGNHAIITLGKDHLTQLFHDLNRIVSLVETTGVASNLLDGTSLGRLSNLLELMQPHAEEWKSLQNGGRTEP